MCRAADSDISISIRATVSAGAETATVHVRQVLDPRGRSAGSRFTPTLTRSVPRRAFAYAGFTSVERAAPLLFGLSGIGGGVGETTTLVREAGRLLADNGVDFARDVLPLFGREVAVAVLDAGGSPGLVRFSRPKAPGPSPRRSRSGSPRPPRLARDDRLRRLARMHWATA